MLTVHMLSSILYLLAGEMQVNHSAEQFTVRSQILKHESNFPLQIDLNYVFNCMEMKSNELVLVTV